MLSTAFNRARAVAGLFMLAASLVLFSGGVQAMDLSVTPKLCITDKADKTCEMTLDFVWQTNDSGNYCLVEKASQASLQCWQQDNSGQWQAVTVVTNKRVFWMSEDGTAQPLDQEVVEVLSTYSEDRRKNRRRKHVWSIM